MPVFTVTSVPFKISDRASQPYLIHNTGDNTIYLGTDSSVSPGFRGYTLVPSATLHWGTTGELWAVTDQGFTSELEWLYDGNSPAVPGPSSVATVNSVSTGYNSNLPVIPIAGSVALFDGPVTSFAGFTLVYNAANPAAIANNLEIAVNFEWYFPGTSAIAADWYRSSSTGVMTIQGPVRGANLRVTLYNYTGAALSGIPVALIFSTTAYPAYYSHIFAPLNRVINGAIVASNTDVHPGGYEQVEFITNAGAQCVYMLSHVAGYMRYTLLANKNVSGIISVLPSYQVATLDISLSTPGVAIESSNVLVPRRPLYIVVYPNPSTDLTFDFNYLN